MIARLGIGLLGLGIEMVRQLGRQHALGQLFLELAGQARFAQDRFRILVLHLRQSLVNQFVWQQLGGFNFGLVGLAHCFGHDLLLSLSSHDLFPHKNSDGLM
jgi:hypothetical protein